MDKEVSKDGAELSGGEKQKIAVSRAYMSDKEIMIFDEPSSALDPIAEMDQFMNIKEKIKGKTAILISHRVGFARLADRIIVMDNGKIIEDGTHENLILKNGVYADLFNKQAQWYDRGVAQS
ncbi:ABC transporter ATP-binding protein [Clostridium simiarum]|uniref:ABC transporter ATP-binding protein n=1 Tax=Clostridium simiarum TaxID=2841506 RepID=UPI0031B85B35